MRSRGVTGLLCNVPTQVGLGVRAPTFVCKRGHPLRQISRIG
jgi:hypothetical protein